MALPPVPRGIRTFNTQHKCCSSSLPVTLIPNSGISVAGLSTGYVIGLYFNILGMGIYQPSVGIGTAVTVQYSNGGDYLPIFDIARLLKVRVTAFFSNNSSSVNSVTNNIPLLYSAVDFDGTNNPTTTGAVLSYDNSKVIQANSMGRPCVDETFQPRLTNQFNTAVLATAFGGPSPAGTWIDATSYAAPHYGMFIAYDPQGATQNTTEGQLTVICESWIQWGANH